MIDNIKRNLKTKELRICDEARQFDCCFTNRCLFFGACADVTFDSLSEKEKEAIQKDYFRLEDCFQIEKEVPAKKAAVSFIRKATISEQEEMVEAEKLVILKSRVEAAAKKCPQARNVLKELFPQAFDAKGFRCGSIFAVQTARIHCSPAQKILLAYKSKHRWLLQVQKSPSVGEYRYQANLLIQLVHTRTTKQYRLIHMASGYLWSDKTYIREQSNSKLITIPAEDLEGTTLVYQPGD